ncbi:MAG TPA: hypothetical protein VFO28_14745 [Burkholderiaceae bacterium]|nr:hypothetical protein [Burkholderiaceae bacterium]
MIQERRSRDELLARLARLDPRDRSWLLGELPPALRRELVAELAGDEPEPAKAAVEPKPASGWEALDAGRVAELLALEPVWLASAATRGSDPAWREKFMAAMPNRRRHEIELADRTGRPLNARAARLVLDACRERVTSAAPGKPPARHGFAALVEQMKARFA